MTSLGHDDFDGQLNHPCSAHPKVDRANGEFFIFAYDVEAPVIHCSAFDKSRKLMRNFKVPITNVRMIHDFVLTEKFIMIPDQPMEFDPMIAVNENKFVFNFMKDKPCRYGIMPRGDKDASNIKWFSTEAHVVLHFCNAWNEVNAAGEDVLVAWAVVHNELDISLR